MKPMLTPLFLVALLLTHAITVVRVIADPVETESVPSTLVVLGARIIALDEAIECVELGEHDKPIEAVSGLEGFRPLTACSPPENGVESIYWLRVSVQNPTDRAIRYHITLRKGGFWRADLGILDESGQVGTEFSYNALSQDFGANAVSATAALPFDVEAGETRVVFVRIKAYYLDRLEPTLVRNDEHQSRQFLLSIAVGTVFGMLIGVSLLNTGVLRGISGRDAVRYISAHGAIILYIAVASGILTSIAPKIDTEYLSFSLLPGLSALGFGLMLLFTIRFYRLETAANQVFRALIGCAVAACLIAAALVTAVEPLISVVTILAPPLVIVSLALLAYAMSRTSPVTMRERLWLYLGWGSFLMGMVLSFLSDHGVILRMFPYLSLKGDQLGYLLLAVFTAPAISGRVRAVRHDRERMRLVAEQARSRVREIESISRAKADLVADLSHDLRTPVTNIRLSLESLLDDPGVARPGRPTSEESQAEVRLMLDQTRLLASRIDHLLTYSRLDRPLVDTALVSIDLIGVIPGLLARFRSLARDRGIELGLKHEASSLVVRVQEEMLDSIVSNLVDNALRYTPAGGEVGVFLSRHEEYARISVEDSGPGIHPTDVDRLFARGQGEQTGLGLAIVRGFTERLGGTVEVESSEAGGARFVVSLPLVRDSSPGTETGEAVDSEGESPASNETEAARRPVVLVVEDDPVLLRHLESLLSGEYQPVAVGSAEEALEIIPLRRPRLLVSDVALPGMSGLELLSELHERKLDDDLPVLIVTARHEPQVEGEAFRLGAIDVIHKPFSRRVFLRKVRSVVGYADRLRTSIEAGLIASVRGWEQQRSTPGTDPDSRRSSGWRIRFALTERQERVLSLVVKGYTNQEIAGILGLSRRTVENHVSRLLEKFNVDRRTQLTYDVLEGDG